MYGRYSMTGLKQGLLEDNIRKLGSLAVAFSGGTDSTFLLAEAAKVLGERVIAVSARSCFVPAAQTDVACDFCRQRGIKHIVFDADPLSVPECRDNPPDRCYHCKRLIFSEIRRIASENGIENVAEGSNSDDLNDYRPGLRALEELGIISPLKDAGLSKEEIRMLSKEMGLQSWNAPADACLATRISYGEVITPEKLRMTDEAERFLKESGFTHVRVRLHGNLARIEVAPEEIERLASDEMRKRVLAHLYDAGYTYVTVDMGGFCSGSMNKASDAGPELWGKQ